MTAKTELHMRKSNAGVNIALPANFEISPRIAYNRCR